MSLALTPPRFFRRCAGTARPTSISGPAQRRPERPRRPVELARVVDGTPRVGEDEDGQPSPTKSTIRESSASRYELVAPTTAAKRNGPIHDVPLLVTS